MMSPSPLPDAHDKDEEAALDQPLQPPGRKRWPPVIHIVIWIVFSNTTILFNKWIMDSAGFRYPIILTCWHLVFTTFATQILARTTSLLDSRHKRPLTRPLYLRVILPIALFYSSSLALSNMAYLHLPVAFIQMLKAAAPIAILLASWAWGLADPSLSAFLSVMIIVFGAALASFGHVAFSSIGFLYQVSGIIFEAIRVIMTQSLLSDKGFSVEPLVMLYYYAPACASLTGISSFWSEVPRLSWGDLTGVGFGMLLLNAIVAFMVNVTSVIAMERTSALVMTLTGIFKNTALIILSAALWHTEITTLQVVGYTITLIGLVRYSVSYEQIAGGGSVIYAYIATPMKMDRFVLAGALMRRVLLAGLVLGGLLLIAFVPANRLYTSMREPKG